jgi:flagellar hook-associated protein 3 FlgL
MPIRIASAHAFDTSLANLQRRQMALGEAQEQLTSGKRVLRPSDDPTAAARAERALAQMSRTDANQRALEASRSTMQQTEVALGDAGDLLQQVREQMVAAGNASYSDSERQIVAVALRGLRTQLLAVANRGDGAGGFLFGGQGSTSEPFVDAPGGVSFAGTTGSLRAATDDPLPLSVDGQAAWMGARDPSTGLADISLFDVIDQTVAMLDTANQSSGTVVAALHDSLRNIDAVANNVSGWRSRSGESLSRADSMEERLGQVRLGAQRERSDAEDLDMVESISAFQSKQTGYQAALQTYSMVQRLSMFDYIGR